MLRHLLFPLALLMAWLQASGAAFSHTKNGPGFDPNGLQSEDGGPGHEQSTVTWSGGGPKG